MYGRSIICDQVKSMDTVTITQCQYPHYDISMCQVLIDNFLPNAKILD